MRLLVNIKHYLSMLFYFLGISRIINWCIKLRNGNNASLLVLCYHSVKREEAGMFERQLDFLCKHDFEVLSGLDVAALIEDPTLFDSNTRYVCLTFDDCYENNYSVVRQILLQRNISAIFFAPSRRLGVVSDWVACNEQNLIMSREQLIEMAEHFEIGAHSRQHVQLGDVDASLLPDEISGSKADLELLLAKHIRFFAFPNGSYNNQVLDLVNATSFKAAFTIEQHINYSFADKYRLGRYIVNPNDYWEFKLKTGGGYDWFYYTQKILTKIL